MYGAGFELFVPRSGARARSASRGARPSARARQICWRVIVSQMSPFKENGGIRKMAADVHEITTCTRYARVHSKMHRDDRKDRHTPRSAVRYNRQNRTRENHVREREWTIL